MAKVESVPLGEVAEINPPVPAEVLEDPTLRISFVPMSAVNKVSASVMSPEERDAGDCRKGYKPFARGDVLVAKITPCFENGKIVLADIPHLFGFGSTEFHIVRPRPAILDSRYLLHVLRQPAFRLKGERRMTGSAGQRRVPEHFLSTFAIPLPPLAGQRRIAEILDKADALRAKRRAVLAQLDTLTQSIFLDMFGDPATNPKGWPKKSLGDISRDKPNNGIFRKNPDYVQEGSGALPVVWVEELFRGDSIDTTESRRVIPRGSEREKSGLKTGDILFCRSSLKLDGIAFNNVYLGKDNAALFECHLIRLSPNISVVSPVFLNCVLRLPQLRAVAKSKSKTATMTTIDQQGLCAIHVPLPPVALQHEFEQRVTAVQRQRAVHRSSLAGLDRLFASLQYRAFRGEL
jgi:type I restriction enzyme S subunit